MTNEQNIFLTVWVCFVLAYIGYEIGGVLLALASGVSAPAIFLGIGD